MKRLIIAALLLGTLSISSCHKNKNDDDDIIEVQTTPWPSWVFKHWVWEDESTEQSAKQIVDDYLARDIPVGAIIIDSPWETGYNTFEFDNSLFPNPQAMIDYFHGKGVRVFMWTVCAVNIDAVDMYEEAKSKGYFMKKNATDTVPGQVKWWKGTGSLIDFYNPDALAWWKSKMDITLGYKIDGWKCDGTDFYVNQTPYSPSKGMNVTRVEYSRTYYQLFHDYTRQKLGIDRVLTARPIDNYGFDAGGEGLSFSPKEIGFACWVGDQDATFTGLTKAMNNMYHSDKYGYLSFGSDIGGYREDDAYPGFGRSKELFVRWAQFGAFSPIMENGGGGEHRPWMFGNDVTDIYRKYVKLHNVMNSYLMSTADSVYKIQKPIMQFFNKTDYSFMLGPDIYVRPVIQDPAPTYTLSAPDNGEWVYLFDQTQVASGSNTVTITPDLTQYPVLVRKNSKVYAAFNKILNP
jgi:alpha-glucosidase (family GH31 glycosyl hydrolase)